MSSIATPFLSESSGADEYDPLDILNAPVGEPAPTRRASERLRVASTSSKARGPSPRKRKRTLSLSTANNKPPRVVSAKKPKVEEKKAVSGVYETRRVAFIFARDAS